MQPHLGKTQKSDGNNFASHLRRRRQHQLVGLDGRVAENFIRKVDYAAEFYLLNVMQTYCHIVFGSVCPLTEIHYKVIINVCLVQPGCCLAKQVHLVHLLVHLFISLRIKFLSPSRSTVQESIPLSYLFHLELSPEVKIHICTWHKLNSE